MRWNNRTQEHSRGLRQQAALDAFEAVTTTQRADEPLPDGRLGVTHYRAIHHHLFQDVYVWAGKFRTVRIAKDGSAFCYPEHIAREMADLFSELRESHYLRDLDAQQFSDAAAHFLATLNAIHPFREGNGRTQTTFLALMADQAGHGLDLERLKPSTFLKAMVASFKGDEQPLANHIRKLVS